MTQDLNTEIKIGADASGVETGVAGAKKALASLGQAADQVGRTGGEGLKKIGAGGEDSARRLDSATKNMVASLQRQIAAAEAGGTANRQYQESIARLRGADVNALKPYLDQLDAARDKAEKAARANAGALHHAACDVQILAETMKQLMPTLGSFAHHHIGSVFVYFESRHVIGDE